MNTLSSSQTNIPASTKVQRNLAPALTLIVLAPVIAEVLSGATRLSYIFVLIPEMMVWGCGALLIREIVRRWDGGGTSMLMLGLALSIAEEFIIQQTSLAPLPWLGSAAVYSRQWGVNWLYFLFMLGYESVLVVLVPVQITELIFHERRKDQWLRTRGLIISSLVFLLGSFFAWFLWTQRARPLTYHVPPYHPSPVLLAAAVLAIVGLVAFAYFLRNFDHGPLSAGRTPSAWIVGLAVLVMGFPWYILMGFVFSPTIPHKFSFWLPMAAGIVWAVLAFLVIRRWSLSQNWDDTHRWAVTFGATLVGMTAGYLGSSTWPRADLIAKIIFNVIAVAGFVLLATRIRRREKV